MSDQDTIELRLEEPAAADMRMRSRSQVNTNLRFLSRQLTDRSRFLSIAVITACWALSNGRQPNSLWMMMFCMGVSVAVLFCDYMQYLAQYFYFSRIERKLSQGNLEQSEIDSHSLLYRSRWFFFEAKIALTGLLAILFCVTIWLEMRAAPSPVGSKVEAPVKSPSQQTVRPGAKS